MGRFICKIRDRYFEWSTVVDAPITYGMTMDELRSYIQAEYGNRGLDELPRRMERVERTGVSAFGGMTLSDLIAGNRAGDEEATLTVDEIYEQYAQPPTD